MSKILISSLGIGQKKDNGYKIAKYNYNNRIIESEFISKALTQFLKIDKLFLIGTKGSIWDSAYNQFEGSDEDTNLELYNKIDNKVLELKDLRTVEETIDKNLKSDGSKCFLIEYGVNETELWNNFNEYIKILDYINDGDEIFLDITHSFRSLSLMSFIMLEFGTVIQSKKIKVSGIFYGMLDISREKNGITPIVDLKMFYDIMQWIKAINNFKKYGNGFEISELLDENDKNIKNSFENFSKIFSIGYMASLQQFINNSDNKIVKLLESDDPIVKLISKDIIDFFKRFKKIKKLSLFQLELAKWFNENKNYRASYSALLESMITYVCEKNNLSTTDKYDREIAKKSIKNKNYNKDIVNLFHVIRKIRNNSSHLIVERESYISDIDNLGKRILKVEIFLMEI